MPRPDLETIREILRRREPRRLEDAADIVAPRAAVATILRGAHDEPNVLLIRRAEHPTDPWSGHMAFPGGRRDPGDPDLFHTAVRETLEEIGIDLRSDASFLGQLDDLPAIARGRLTGMVITPFVFEIANDPAFRTNHEVAEIVWAPLGPLLRGELATTRPYVHEGVTYQFPAYDVNGRVVWGLTYQMLESFFALLRERGA